MSKQVRQEMLFNGVVSKVGKKLEDGNISNRKDDYYFLHGELCAMIIALCFFLLII